MSGDLLEKINAAVKAANEAEQSVTTAQAELVSAQAELVSRSPVGLLLLEAKKQHPAVKDLEAFLERVDGLKLARAYDCMRIAGGRTTDEEIRKATKERVKRHRDKKKTKVLPRSEPGLSVTHRDVTETTEAEPPKADPVQTAHIDSSASADAMRAKMAALDDDPSARNLAEFQAACQTYLPCLTEVDLKKARVFFMEGKWKPRGKKQEAA